MSRFQVEQDPPRKNPSPTTMDYAQESYWTSYLNPPVPKYLPDVPRNTLSSAEPCQTYARPPTQTYDTSSPTVDNSALDTEQESTQEVRKHHPISNLPPEIIGLIFSLALPCFTLQEPGEYDPSSRPPSDLAALVVLGAVCRHWRQIAWTTPSLWSNLMLTVKKEPTSNMIEIIKNWLDRSGVLPLSIRLDFDAIFYGHSLGIQHFVDIIRQHSSRWRDLSIRGQYCLLESFTDLSPDAQPFIETVQLLPLSEKEMRFEFHTADPMDTMERAISLGYRQLQDVKFRWEGLSNATIDRLVKRDCFKLLIDAPHLQILRVEKMGEGPSVDIPESPIIHQHLRILDISSPTHLGSVLDCFTFPALEELGLHGFWEHHSCRYPSQSVVQLLQRSRCPLVSFAIGRGSCSEEDILKILDLLPESVRNIELDIQAEGADIDLDLGRLFRRVGRDESVAPEDTDSDTPSRANFLPNLETFAYSVFKGTEVPWDLLPIIPRPVSGTRRPFKKLSVIERIRLTPNRLYRMTSRNVGLKTVKDLLEMDKDGIKFDLPGNVGRQDFFMLLDDLEPDWV